MELKLKFKRKELIRFSWLAVSMEWKRPLVRLYGWSWNLIALARVIASEYVIMS